MKSASLFLKILKRLGIVLACILVIILAVIIYAFIRLSGNVENLQRIDSDGSLYYADYVGDYNNNFFSILPVKIVQNIGCSALTTYNDQGNVITARNYDLPHKDNEGNITGLNVVVRCTPEGKYKSIGIADAAFMSVIGLDYFKGCLDDGHTTQLPLFVLPYLCMDGINEKGLCASILALDTKEGETAANQNVPGKDSLQISELLRRTIDNCATVEEAIALADSYNMVGMLGRDYHLYVSDASGVSAVLEWRYNTLTVTYTNASTNFYLGYDDAEDVYRKDGTLKEKFIMPEDTTYLYHYGYGHGYGRFAVVAESLEDHVVSKDPYKTVMTNNEAMETLKSCSQDYDGESVTSFTQYSVIYDNSSLSMDVSPMRRYDEIYHFSIN